MNKNKLLITVITFGLFFSCKSDQKKEEQPTKTEKQVENKQKEKPTPPKEEIPFKTIKTLSGFDNPGANWVEIGSLTADFDSVHKFNIKEGKGVILNTNEKPKKHLFTNVKHRDIELDLEFMLPKKSNSGIYFQGRYEIQLLDSWGVKDPSFSDCGGIYQRWDNTKPKGQKGYEGVPPRVNASKAPGLWQHYKIIFKAPRFDANGNKIANAKFEKVIHNGIIIHENVEVTGPTRAAFFGKETSEKAPIMIQGDHGPIAFKNIKYKLYDYDAKISNLTYELYEGEYKNVDQIKQEDIKKTGEISGFYVDSIVKNRNPFALKFNGDLEIPNDGDYIFHEQSAWGSKLYIDDALVIHNDIPWRFNLKSKKIKLKKGKHNIKLKFFFVKWRGPELYLGIEGPDMQKKPLASFPLDFKSDKRQILIQPNKKHPRIQRGFIQYKKEKKTKTICVGYPSKLNYTIDSENGSLLQFWKGDFGNVADMWHARGNAQLFIPLGVVAKGSNYPVVKRCIDKNKPWEDCETIELSFKGYSLNEKKEPTFSYKQGEMYIEDFIAPSKNERGFERKLSFLNVMKDTWFNVARANEIIKVKENLYSIDNNYYIRFPENSDFKLRQIGNKKELLLPLSKKLNYSIIW